MTESVGIVFFGIGVFAGIFMLGLCFLLFTMALIPYYGKIRESSNRRYLALREVWRSFLRLRSIQHAFVLKHQISD